MSLTQSTTKLPVTAIPAEAREEMGKLSQLSQQSWPGMSLVSKLPDWKREKKKERERKKGCGRKSPVNQLASHFQFKYFHKCLAVISMQGMSTAGERFLRWQRIPLDDKLSSDKLQSRQFPFGSPRSLLICSRILRLLKRKASWLSVAFVNLIHWERETVLKCRKIPKFKTPAAYYVFDLNNVPSEKTFTQVLDVSQTALQTSCV